METRTISKTRRVDSMGDSNNCGRDDFTGDHCICFASEREGKDCCFDKFSVLIFSLSPPPFITQREDELERRRVSHHINFDAL